MKKSSFLFLIFSFCFFSFLKAQTITDFDGNQYDTLVIGTQVWLKQDLKTTHYRNGVAIPNVTDSVIWGGLTTAARCYYNNDSATNAPTYGSLYNWHVANDTNICPLGYRVPSDEDWTDLEDFLGGDSVAGAKLKEAGTTHWLSPNAGATNTTSFTGLPAGWRNFQNTYALMGENVLYWTTSTQGAGVWTRYLWYMFEGVDRNLAPKMLGMCIRCMKNLPSDVGEITPEQNLKLYPNPANDKLFVASNTLQNGDVVIIDMLGKIVAQQSLMNSKTIINTNHLLPGVYSLKIIGINTQIQSVFVKQ